jgi:hypothetical protein
MHQSTLTLKTCQGILFELPCRNLKNKADIKGLYPTENEAGALAHRATKTRGSLRPQYKTKHF